MITPSDVSYKKSKLVKQGKQALKPPLDILAKWISSKWDVSVLNIIFDKPFDKYRLEVILEYEAELQSFRDREFNFDSKKQLAIADKYRELSKRNLFSLKKKQVFFVVFSGFDRIAKMEANSRLTICLIEKLQTQINEPDLWCISRCFGGVTFMFFTDVQVKKHDNEEKKKDYAKAYFQILMMHDEFGYLLFNDFTISFDSKQNLDENYQGNWLYYYR